jgi:hypothetical protein
MKRFDCIECGGVSFYIVVNDDLTQAIATCVECGCPCSLGLDESLPELDDFGIDEEELLTWASQLII